MTPHEAKKILTKRRADLVKDLAEIEQDLDAPATKDWEDRASERQGDEVLEARGHQEQEELRRIDAALSRIDDGTYGECQKCGEDISAERLEILPATPLCKSCAAAAGR